MLAPTLQEAPVMIAENSVDGKANAEIDSSANEPVRVTLADIPQRRVFDPTVLIRQTLDARPETPERNLYLALLSEGKLKPFATTAMLAQGSSASGASESSTRNSERETRSASASDSSSDSSTRNSKPETRDGSSSNRARASIWTQFTLTISTATAPR
jgi:hypothetical protein